MDEIARELLDAVSTYMAAQTLPSAETDATAEAQVARVAALLERLTSG